MSSSWYRTRWLTLGSSAPHTGLSDGLGEVGLESVAVVGDFLL
jgi:hypothetical protein